MRCEVLRCLSMIARLGPSPCRENPLTNWPVFAKHVQGSRGLPQLIRADARELFGKRDDGIDHWPDRSPLERMSDDGVPAYEACQLTCGTCSFSLHDSDMTYKKCKKACEKKGLRMPCITSKAVDEALESAIKQGGDYYGWIAYNDKDTEGDFAWEDGCTSSYTNWDAGPPQEPNNDAPYR